jgi:hypothetical protein
MAEISGVGGPLLANGQKINKIKSECYIDGQKELILTVKRM